MRFCANSGGGEKLEEAFSSLSLQSTSLTKAASSTSSNNSNSHTDIGGGGSGREVPPPGQKQTAQDQNDDTKTQSQNQELSTLVMAMRKLREAIVASHRVDEFAQRVYIFIIHATILTKHWESYLPALLYLLRAIHPQTPLPQPELQELVGYWVLDLACRQNEIGEAWRVRCRYRLRDRRVDRVIRALVHDDWVVFWRYRRLVDGYQRALMGWAEDAVRVHALKCLGRTYMSADRAYVERATDRKWEDLVKSGVGWELGDGDVITIRRPKAK